MSEQNLGRIVGLHGDVKIVDAHGHIHVIAAGGTVPPGSHLILANGAEVQLLRADGQTVTIDGPRDILLSEDTLAPQAVDPTDASSHDAAQLNADAAHVLANLQAGLDPVVGQSIGNAGPGTDAARVLANLQAGLDPTAGLAPAEAGLDAGQQAEEGSHSFVRLLRISENLSPLSTGTGLQNAQAIEPRAFSAGNDNPNHGARVDNGSGSVVEQTQVSTSGHLVAVDSASHALPFDAGVLQGAYGSLTLDAQGNWSYTLDDRSLALAQNQAATDNFTVTLANGWQTTVDINITGTNSVAAIGGNDHGLVTEDQNVTAQGTLVTSGTLSISDADAGQSAFVPGSVTAPDGARGVLTIDAAGHWTYTVADSAVQDLRAGQDAIETYLVHSVDGSVHTVTIEIDGINHAVSITGTGGTVVEDTNVNSAGMLVTSGQMVLLDPDHIGRNHIDTTSVTLLGGGTALGTLTVNDDGSWSYSVNNAESQVQALTAGESLTETYLVRGVDGTTHTLTMEIDGVAHPSVVLASGFDSAGRPLTDTGFVSSAAPHDAANYLTTSGQVWAEKSQGNHGETDFSTTVISTAQDWGSLTIDSQGAWSYSVDPAKVAALAAGQIHVDSFVVTTADNVPHIITVDLGQPLVLGGDTHATVTENTAVDSSGYLVASGTLTFTEPDSALAVRDKMDTWQLASQSGQTHLGALTVDATGHWSYQVNNSLAQIQSLQGGQSLSDSFVLTAIDGYTTQVVSITINGVDHSAQQPTVSTGFGGIFTETFDSSGDGTFTWQSGDPGSAGHPTYDVLYGFQETSGNKDTLDLRNLLSGEHNTDASLEKYLHFENTANGLLVHVSATGQYNAGDSAAQDAMLDTKQILLPGVAVTNNGAALSDHQILDALLAQHQIVVHP
ncbi:VCBS domain-containing protein [Paludibacterium yongneupense]|uniref:VCBS domain-containing protein n=1 Tax=Paludibacterium yongneupense TaxID=400061 RepID=UPI00041DC6D4|nr:VCBS domain-containing protein [Paludibacterium yongneupense]